MLKKLSMIIFFFPSAATSPSSAVLQHNFLCFPGQPPISAHLGPSQLVSLSHSAARATARCPRRAAVTSKVTCSCSAVCTLQDMTQTAQIWLRCCHMLPQCQFCLWNIMAYPRLPNRRTASRNTEMRLGASSPGEATKSTRIIWTGCADMNWITRLHSCWLLSLCWILLSL